MDLDQALDPTMWQKLMETALEWGILLGKAILVYAIGQILIRMALGILSKVLQRAHTDEMLIKFARSIANAGLKLVLVIIALGVMGIDTTSLIAILASAGLAIGLALQDSMKNFASGVLLLSFKPFQKGDFVNAGLKKDIRQSLARRVGRQGSGRFQLLGGNHARV